MSDRNKVVFDDEQLLLVNKAPGIITLDCRGSRGKPTLQSWLKKEVFPKNFFTGGGGDFSQRSGIVHRLDKDTSGLVLVAKNTDSFKNLQTQFKQGKVKKAYRALVVGDIPLSGTINVPIKRMSRPRTKYGVSPQGKKSVTSYKVIDKLKKDISFYSYLEVYPLTGRTHQIRVHLSYLGYPIVGDSLYGYDTEIKPGRMLLHAQTIDFFHPVNNNHISFSVSPPKNFLKAVGKLGLKNGDEEKKNEKK